MSDSETDPEADQLADLPDLVEKYNRESRYPQVSGWEEDDEGIEDDRNPEDRPSRNILKFAENGNLDALLKLLDEDESLIAATDKDGYTPLHRASYNNNFQIAKVLLERGASHCAKTIDNWEPLHSASKWNSLECVEILLEHGADVNAASKAGGTPLHLAAGNGEASAVVQLLLSHPLLIPNLKDQSGDTPSEIAHRTGLNGYLFETQDPCFL